MVRIKQWVQGWVQNLSTWPTVISLGSALWLGGFTPAVVAAERITTFVGPLEISVSVDSLEKFAKTGEVNKDLALVVGFLDEATREQFRKILQQRLDLDPVMIYRATHVPLVENFLHQLGEAIQPAPGTNGMHSLRGAIVTAALDEAEGLTPLNFMRSYAAQDIHLNLGFVLDVLRELERQNEYREAAIAEITREAALEAEAEADLVNDLPDLRQRGPYQVKKETLAYTVDSLRPTEVGLRIPYQLNFDLYWPEGRTDSAPLIVIVQGFGSSKRNYQHFAEHMTSYGFAVASPEHAGSNLEYRQAFLRGEIGDIITPIEYLSRVLDVTHLLDQFEARSQQGDPLAQRLNLEQVGVMGYSFGGATALAIGGAEFNQARLAEQCQEDSLSPAFQLQCQAQYLPPVNFRLEDPRVKAIFAAYPLASIIYGPEGIGKIDVPTMIWAGSEDVVTPVIPNQIHPFIWLKEPHKYLGLMIPGAHFSTSSDEVQAATPGFLVGPEGIGPTARGYLHAFGTAFFKRYLADQTEYDAYLTAAQAHRISDPNFRLDFIQNLTAEQLRAAYGKTPPTPIIPEPVLAEVEPREESVLAEIERTGKLRVAVRSDAPPIGFLSENGNWTGYCADFLNALETELENRLDNQEHIYSVVIPSTAANRYDLINHGVHLECGPNTIRRDVPGVTFTQPFFASGAQFLVPASLANSLGESKDAYVNLPLGVVEGSTTETFLQQDLGAEDTTTFSSRTQAIQALNQGEIQALASDGTLAIAEVMVLGLPPQNYALVPSTPMTCEYYGLALPAGDEEWQRMVNQLISNNVKLRQADSRWLRPFSSRLITELETCFRQR